MSLHFLRYNSSVDKAFALSCWHNYLLTLSGHRQIFSGSQPQNRFYIPEGLLLEGIWTCLHLSTDKKKTPKESQHSNFSYIKAYVITNLLPLPLLASYSLTSSSSPSHLPPSLSSFTLHSFLIILPLSSPLLSTFSSLPRIKSLKCRNPV